MDKNSVGFTTCSSYPYSVALSEYNMKQMLMQRAACPWLYVREKIVFNGWMFYSYIGFVARSAIERRRWHAKDAVVVIVELLLPCHSWIELAPIGGASIACRNARASSPPPIPSCLWTLWLTPHEPVDRSTEPPPVRPYVAVGASVRFNLMRPATLHFGLNHQTRTGLSNIGSCSI